jgi:hypothetical protein
MYSPAAKPGNMMSLPKEKKNKNIVIRREFLLLLEEPK